VVRSGSTASRTPSRSEPPNDEMRWVVTVVIAYAAIAMLHSAWACQLDAPLLTVPE
jgi:hypothetical protein